MVVRNNWYSKLLKFPTVSSPFSSTGIREWTVRCSGIGGEGPLVISHEVSDDAAEGLCIQMEGIVRNAQSEYRRGPGRRRFMNPPPSERVLERKIEEGLHI
jgi:hypothetical protein